MTRLSRELLVPPGAAAVLECTADANPTTEHMISWARDDFDLEDSNKTKTFYSNGSGFLTVYRASREDIGLFLCMIDNGIGALNVTAGLLVERESKSVVLVPAKTWYSERMGYCGVLCKNNAEFD